jgi:hypothetical protein
MKWLMNTIDEWQKVAQRITVSELGRKWLKTMTPQPSGHDSTTFATRKRQSLAQRE